MLDVAGLLRRLAEHRDADAIAFGDQTYSHAWLGERVERWGTWENPWERENGAVAGD